MCSALIACCHRRSARGYASGSPSRPRTAPKRYYSGSPSPAEGGRQAPLSQRRRQRLDLATVAYGAPQGKRRFGARCEIFILMTVPYFALQTRIELSVLWNETESLRPRTRPVATRTTSHTRYTRKQRRIRHMPLDKGEATVAHVRLCRLPMCLAREASAAARKSSAYSIVTTSLTFTRFIACVSEPRIWIL